MIKFLLGTSIIQLIHIDIFFSVIVSCFSLQIVPTCLEAGTGLANVGSLFRAKAAALSFTGAIGMGLPSGN